MRRRRRRGLRRSPLRRFDVPLVQLVLAGDPVDRVVDRRLDEREPVKGLDVGLSGSVWCRTGDRAHHDLVPGEDDCRVGRRRRPGACGRLRVEGRGDRDERGADRQGSGGYRFEGSLSFPFSFRRLDVVGPLLQALWRARAASRRLRRSTRLRFRSVSDRATVLASRPGGEADGVPDPGTARGVGRGRRGLPGRAQAARAARRAPSPPERGRSYRPADRRALGRGLARARRRRTAGQRLATSQGAAAGRADDQSARLRRPGRARRARPAPLRAAGGRGEELARTRPRRRRVGAAPRGAVVVARPGARGLRVREFARPAIARLEEIRLGGGRAPRRRRPRTRTPRRAGRGARGSRRRAPSPRAPPEPI